MTPPPTASFCANCGKPSVTTDAVPGTLVCMVCGARCRSIEWVAPSSVVGEDLREGAD